MSALTDLDSTGNVYLRSIVNSCVSENIVKTFSEHNCRQTSIDDDHMTIFLGLISLRCLQSLLELRR